MAVCKRDGPFKAVGAQQLYGGGAFHKTCVEES